MLVHLLNRGPDASRERTRVWMTKIKGFEFNHYKYFIWFTVLPGCHWHWYSVKISCKSLSMTYPKYLSHMFTCMTYQKDWDKCVHVSLYSHVCICTTLYVCFSMYVYKSCCVCRDLAERWLACLTCARLTRSSLIG